MRGKLTSNDGITRRTMDPFCCHQDYTEFPVDSSLETLQACPLGYVTNYRGNPGNEKRVVFRGNPGGNGELVGWFRVGFANFCRRLSQLWNKFETLDGVHNCAPAKKFFFPLRHKIFLFQNALPPFGWCIFLVTVLISLSVSSRLNLKWFAFTNTTISNTWT